MLSINFCVLNVKYNNVIRRTFQIVIFKRQCAGFGEQSGLENLEKS